MRWMSVTIAVLFVFVFVAGCGSSDGSEGAAPGFDASPTTADPPPFTLARPTNASTATTMAGLDDPPATGLPGVTPSSSSTTTTTAVPTPGLPEISTITSICGFARTIESFSGLHTEGAARTEELLRGLPLVLARYEEVAPEDVRPDLAAIRTEVEQLGVVLARNGWNARSSAYQQALDAVSGEAAAFPRQLSRVGSVEQAACG